MAADITELQEIVSANGTHVLSAMDLKRKYGPSIQTRQVHALHRIAYLLHTEEPVIDVKTPDLSIKTVEARRIRLIHPAHGHLVNRETAASATPAMPAPHKSGPATRSAHAASQPPNKDQCCKPDTAKATQRGDCDHAEPAVPDTKTPQPTQDTNACDAAATDSANATMAATTPLAPAADDEQQVACGPRRRRKATAAAIGMRRALEEDASSVTGRDTAAYTTRQQRAARWQQADEDYGSPAQAISNAQRALQAAGYHTHAWQARQIIAWRQLTTGNTASLRAQKNRHAKGTLRKRTQKQYLVDWQPNAMEPWEVQLWQRLGYKAQEVTPVSHTTLATDPEYAVCYDLLSCEVCNKADAEVLLLQCDECHRLYHTHCIHLPTVPTTHEGWSCVHCGQQSAGQNHRGKRHRACTAQPAAAKDAHMPQQLVMVRWAPSWEPEENVEGTDALTDWQQLQQHQDTATGDATQRPDGALTDMQKQGIYGSNMYISHMQPQVRHQLKLEHQPINPYIDIAPQGRYRIEIRTILERQKQQNLQYTAACCYGPDGRSIGQVSLPRLQMLKQIFDTTLATCPDTTATLKPACFEQELYRLLARYKPGSSIDGTRRRVDLKNHWTTPPQLMNILQHHLGISKERFASPLNFNERTQHYWSCHARDQLFGALHDAYSCKWSGISECNPEYEHSDMYKAVAWAVKSARATTDPVLTLCILPAWDESSDTAYCRWLRRARHNCHVLMRVPKACFKFMTPDAWKGVAPYAGHPKWDINFILVGNTPGFSMLTDMDEHALCADVATFLCTTADKKTPCQAAHTPPPGPELQEPEA
jgi:hypothetical protein